MLVEGNDNKRLILFPLNVLLSSDIYVSKLIVKLCV